jgi:hypothetical protein
MYVCGGCLGSIVSAFLLATSVCLLQCHDLLMRQLYLISCLPGMPHVFTCTQSHALLIHVDAMFTAQLACMHAISAFTNMCHDTTLILRLSI